MWYGYRPSEGGGSAESGRVADATLQVGGCGRVCEARIALTRSEQASKNDLTGDGHAFMCRFSIGFDVARQARELRRRMESCIMAVEVLPGVGEESKPQGRLVDGEELGGQ